MLGFDVTAARWTWTASAVLLLLFSIYEIRETIFILILAVMFAYLLTPLVDVINRMLPGRSRTPGLAITYVVLIGLMVVVGIEIGSQVADQATSLVAKAPQFFDKLRSATPRTQNLPYLESLRSDVTGRIQTFLQTRSSDIVSYLPSAGMKVLSFSSYLIFLILVPILSFFLLSDAAQIRDSIIALIPPGPRRDTWTHIMGDTNILLGQYVRSMGVLCLTVFVVFAIALSIFGVPYAILLATIAFPLEIIPMVGPLIAATIIIVVSIATGYDHVLGLIVFLGVYRVFQDYVFSPRLMSSGVEVHPLLVILGVLAGEKLGGIPGMFLSVPVIAFLRVLHTRLTASGRVAERIQLSR